jgi:hypothetical protein
MLGSVRLNRRVSGLTLLQQHHPNLTSVGESCISFFFVLGLKPQRRVQVSVNVNICDVIEEMVCVVERVRQEWVSQRSVCASQRIADVHRFRNSSLVIRQPNVNNTNVDDSVQRTYSASVSSSLACPPPYPSCSSTSDPAQASQSITSFSCNFVSGLNLWFRD